MGQEEAQWDRHHQPSSVGGVPSHLFTDEDPATTIKGTGFKDAATAKLTLHLTSQPGCAYKQYWTVKAMAERARFHPHQTTGMKEALEVFERWLRERRKQSNSQAQPCQSHEERSQRALLANCAANAHARSRCDTEAQHNALIAADRSTALTALKSGIRQFALPATAFVSVFGGPGEHGYGEHRCIRAAEAGLPIWRCTCGFEGKHFVSCETDKFGHGSFKRCAAFELTFDGTCRRAVMTPKPARGQRTLKSFFVAPKVGSKANNDAISSKRKRSGLESSVDHK